MERILYIIFIFYLIYLVAEAFFATRFRHIIKHVIYVNGTRGKSSVTRLIHAGLRAGGVTSYAKTTGTLPMVIDTKGQEILIKRRGRANIKEQIKILRWAAKEKAEVLVVECMAVQPELQYISQHRMVRADIGIITNARLDHLDVMGQNLEEIGQSLCNTIPKGGICFTSDKDFFPLFSSKCELMNCEAKISVPNGSELNFDFPENIALALDVCKYIGVNENVALEGMKYYQRDPYAISIYRLENGAIFIGGLSINDPMSTKIVYDRLIKQLGVDNHKLNLLISNRLDRGYRTLQHQDLAVELNPENVWIIGGNSRVMARSLVKRLPNSNILVLHKAYEMPLSGLTTKDVIFAVGNIAEGGNEVMDLVKREGIPYV